MLVGVAWFRWLRVRSSRVVERIREDIKLERSRNKRGSRSEGDSRLPEPRNFSIRPLYPIYRSLVLDRIAVTITLQILLATLLFTKSALLDRS